MAISFRLIPKGSVVNLASLLTRTALASPTDLAIITGDAETSYADLDVSSARAAALLTSLGIMPGDTVGVMLPNVTEFAVVYYGVLRAGGVVVPMNPLLKSREINYYLSDSGASVIVAWHTTANEVEPAAAEVGTHVLLVDPATFDDLLAEGDPSTDVADRSGIDTAVILYTSGTTGHPKGAELTHDNLTKNVEVTLEDLLQLGSRDVVFGGLPLFHSFGHTVTA
jgi:long-chain acyl-CoA synthetase